MIKGKREEVILAPSSGPGDAAGPSKNHTGPRCGKERHWRASQQRPSRGPQDFGAAPYD